ncbi:transporter substrate-binding domain-containing protein [Leeia oryzae]|uniref:transporter substrate-binding domain-containing protein n=1 Tax=Leeia oryzae TaxID=356662 RepID=UPI0003698D0F|nr:transporter substrate-binding domain-containing protein [Leeia oryzae]
MRLPYLQPVLGFTLLNLALISSLQAQTTIRFGTEAGYPPYNFTTKDGKIGGFEVDLTNAICKQINATCVYIKNDWDSAFDQLDKKKYDVLMDSVTINDTRKQKWLFSDPYLKVPASFVAKRKKFPYTYISAMELKGMKLGVQKGATFERYAQNLLKNSKETTLVGFDDTTTMYKALKAGELDIVLDDMATSEESFLKENRSNGYEFVGSPSRDKVLVGEGVGYVMRKSDTQIQSMLNKGLQAVKKDGTFQLIAQKYFIFNVAP